MRKSLKLIGSLIFLITGCAERGPEYYLLAAVGAARTHDSVKFEKIVDVEELAESIVTLTLGDFQPVSKKPENLRDYIKILTAYSNKAFRTVAKEIVVYEIRYFIKNGDFDYLPGENSKVLNKIVAGLLEEYFPGNPLAAIKEFKFAEAELISKTLYDAKLRVIFVNSRGEELIFTVLMEKENTNTWKVKRII